MIKVSQQNFKPNKFQWATNNRNYSTLLKKKKEKKKGLIAVILWQLRESTVRRQLGIGNTLEVDI